MDRIELATRRFQQILPRPVAAWLGDRTREIESWLRDDVVAAIEGFVHREDFRDHATWPLRHLRPGSDSAARRAVEACDAALVASAAALRPLAEAAAVIEVRPCRDSNAAQAAAPATASGDTPPGSATSRTEVDLILSRNQILQISARRWTDLVCTDDYLQPRGGMMSLDPPPPGVTEGEFIVAFNPELHPLGDFVTRCMIRRIEIRRGCLERFRRHHRPTWPPPAQPHPTQAEAEQRAWSDLESRGAELRALCLAGPAAALRDSCIVLTQAYAAFHPAPDLDWLGLPPHSLQHDIAVLRHRITRSRTSEPVDRIATALGDLRRLARREVSDHGDVRAAIDAGGLVLIRRPRAAYWAGRRLDADWDRNAKAWDFLLALAGAAGRSGIVNERDLYAEPAGASTMANRFRRLKAVLPASLWREIEPAVGRAYRLKLGRSRVHMFEAE